MKGPPHNPLAPDDASVRLGRALDLVRARRVDEARQVFETAKAKVRPDSLSPELALQWVRLCSDLGELEEGWNVASTFLGRLEGADTARLEAHFRVARARLSIRRGSQGGGPRDLLALAERDLRLALLRDPGHPRAYAVFGVLASRLGRKAESVEMWRCAHALAPSDLDARSGLARALFEAGRPKEAEPHFALIASARGDRAEAHINLGVVREAAGDREGARRAFERALELDPSARAAHTGLALLLDTDDGESRGPRTDPVGPSGQSSDLTATLASVSLADLLGFAALRRVTGQLVLRGPRVGGTLQLAAGRLLRVDIRGDPAMVDTWPAVNAPPKAADEEAIIGALTALIPLREGHAELFLDPAQGSSVPVGTRSTGVDTQGALLEAHRRLDEAQHAKARRRAGPPLLKGGRAMSPPSLATSQASDDAST